MSYDHVAIPSYQRAETCAQDTVSVLLAGGVPAGRIHVFVGGGDLAPYRATLPRAVQLHPAPVGQQHAHNTIVSAFPVGARVVTCDDDIRAVETIPQTSNRLERLSNLDGLFSDAFDYACGEGATLWGISPTRNGMFMRHKWMAGLYFARGGLFGQVITDPPVQLRLAAKEDYERTLHHYERTSRVARLQDVATHHRPMRTFPGGMQASGTRVADEWAAVEALMRRWPGLVHPKKERQGYPEVALRVPARSRVS